MGWLLRPFDYADDQSPSSQQAQVQGASGRRRICGPGPDRL